jgi:TetR/AcrR family transcriptional regulator, mexJK operon transcriptional repressor
LAVEEEDLVRVEPADQDAPGRTAAKRRAIRDAAQELFLRNGYAGTSMDEVAALARVSKQTVYKQFADKAQLFTDVVTADIAEAEDHTRAMLDALPDSNDFEAALRRFARQHVTEVLQPRLIQLRRMIIGEATRFPELARTWWENGPKRGHATLAERFQRAAERGHLRLDDPLLAAQHFNWLVLSIPLNAAMFLADQTTFTTAELERVADEGVRVFLAAYGPDRPS